MNRESSRGFTLVEMMVVLVILSIMGMLIVPNILGRPDQARITAARTDIQSIENALELYRIDNFAYPTTAQGLKALIEKPSIAPIPPNWNNGGYLRKLPDDPWGNPYYYTAPGTHPGASGKTAPFDVYSYGADGAEGGGEQDADIGNWQ